VALSRNAPRASSKAADEGTAAHRVCEFGLEHPQKPLSCLEGGSVLVGDGEWPITDEMLEGAELYRETVLKQVGDKGQMFYEHELELPWLGDDIGGTTDSAVIANRRLYINDYKFGRGVMVSPQWNSQLMIYGLAGIGGKIRKDCEEVVLTIIQPRASGDKVKTWAILPEELIAWGNDVLAPAYNKAKRMLSEASPICCPGECCKWCPARPCKAEQQQMAELTKTLYSEPVFQDPSKMSGAELAHLLEYAERFIDFGNAVQHRARMAAESGLIVPGWKMVATVKHRQWKEGTEEKVKELLGEAAYKPRELVSPSQADKVAKDKKEALKELWEKPAGSMALVRESDKRPAIVSSVAAELLSAADFLQ
jgi:hypothetical protein